MQCGEQFRVLCPTHSGWKRNEFVTAEDNASQRVCQQCSKCYCNDGEIAMSRSMAKGIVMQIKCR
jgi:hypothetical protein